MPRPNDASSLLARHEAGLFDEASEVVGAVPHHRSAEVNRLVLPRCQAMVEAIGHRMAYDAAVAAGVKPCLIDLYVASVVKLDPAWYSENAQFSRRAQSEMETKAMDDMLPQLGTFVREMNVMPYINAPIVSDERWSQFVESLETFQGSGRIDSMLASGPPDFEMVRSHL